jgi:lipoprotein NlpD
MAGGLEQMKSMPAGQPRSWGLAALLLLLVTACASPDHRAPVDERRLPARPGSATAPGGSTTAAGTAAEAVPAKVLPGAENAGKPGYYTVKPGDTLLRIGLEAGQNWRDIARWNGIENPNMIEVGQVVRIAPPGTEPGAASARPVLPAGRVEGRPLDGAGAPAGAASGAVAASPAASAPERPSAARDPDDDLNWLWPAAGPVVATFDEVKSKGLAISGKAGDPVLAAADGRVVYAGSGLRGYGNLVIVKHNATYLTAYAHNQTLLVKEDQAVRRGQRIAEMGSSDAERVQLHFEIRRQGRPIDPARLLPPR